MVVIAVQHALRYADETVSADCCTTTVRPLRHGWSFD
jgi:hypothetical protein